MSFPDRAQRKICWDSRDRYWECLDSHNIRDSSRIPKECTEIRKIFEKSCPPKWVTHFDRKREYELFKEKMQKEGFEPIKESLHLCNMDDLSCIISKLAVPTELLTSNILQEILLKIKKNNKIFMNNEYMDSHNSILEALWVHLQTGLKEFDDQLLCSTCFYTVLSIVEKQDKYLQLIQQNIDEELSKKISSKGGNISTMRTVSIIYGIFQSNLLLQKTNQYGCLLEDILKSVMNLLIDMAYIYSHYTFIVFKILASVKKVIGTNLQHTVFTKENQLKLLNMVNHNWENPINGVRNLNKTILQAIVTILDDELYGEVMEEVNNFYWNKAKYLMLSEILVQYNGNIDSVLKKYNIVEGLLHSLHKPGLVSAGADLYFSILNKIKSEEEWKLIFLNKLLAILNGPSQKAIENFNNYWCLTTFNKFSSLNTLIMNALQTSESTELNVFSRLCILRQSYKLSLIEKDSIEMENLERVVINSVEQCSPNIRIVSFEIVCICNDKSWPDNIKYKLVLNYLSDNINSDCTVLRLNMLNSLGSFLNHLQTIYLNSKTSVQSELDNLLLFCVELQNLILSSLEVNGNYQRRITTIKIAGVFLNSLIDIPRKKYKQMKQTKYTIMDFLIEKGQCVLLSERVVEKLIRILRDPADDIRDNVSELLLDHYSDILKKSHIMNEIIDDALLKISSKFFYEINCGKSMFELIIKVLIRKGGTEELKFRNINDIFNFAYKNLQTEHQLKRDIVESIDKGKQLNSYMCILCAIFEAIIKSSYNLQLEKEIIWSLLDILEDTSSQFIWEEGVATSSDFAKISDMVLTIIEKSGYATNYNYDEAKITGLQQIVLNCLWLNVKESCNLASLVIQYYKNDMNLDICRKSLYIITKVLETSRHKGAIEAAGVALGDSIRTLTSLTECQLSELPFHVLEQKLNQFILEAKNMASVTRRGAGLSIMVHRIVSNDMKRNKPLFHYFINTLLDNCKAMQDEQGLNKSELNSEKDLPKAIYIHFLTRIVIDSSLTTEVMYYSAKLVELAFDNLTSSHWQIRNAALQLYGALIPKLMGQRKASGSEDEVTATVACDEFRTHFPQLWVFILNQLKQDKGNDNLQLHSNLLPILNILGNLAKRYNFSNDLKHISGVDNDFFKYVTPLLGSPILTVRRLTAKCIYNMYSFDNIFELLLSIEKPSENFLHGSLLLYTNCHNNYSGVAYKEHFEVLKQKFDKEMNNSQHSYLCLELVESLNDMTYGFSEIQLTLKHIKTNLDGPGKFHWANRRIHKFLLTCPWSVLPQSLQIILEDSNYEKYCDVLYTRLNSENNIDIDVLIEIVKILLCLTTNNNSSVVWKILYKISLLIDFDIHIDIKEITNNFKGDISYKSRFLIPLMARITISQNALSLLCNHIHKLCNAELTDVEMRMIAAMANNELGNKLDTMSDEIKIITIINAVILLQDEDEDVRNQSVYFYKNTTKDIAVLQPYICLRRILNIKFLKSVFSNLSNGVKLVCEGLSNYFSTICGDDSDAFNPFANKSKNIYQEIDIVNQLISKLNDDLQ